MRLLSPAQGDLIKGWRGDRPPFSPARSREWRHPRYPQALIEKHGYLKEMKAYTVTGVGPGSLRFRTLLEAKLHVVEQLGKGVDP